MGNLHCCAAQIKIEIETSNLGGYFFLFISNHMSPLAAKKFKNTQNKDHPNIYYTLVINR